MRILGLVLIGAGALFAAEEPNQAKMIDEGAGLLTSCLCPLGAVVGGVRQRGLRRVAAGFLKPLQ